MHRIQLHYTLSKDAGNRLIRNPLPEMLAAVAQEGSISGAARALGLSYRHVWGALKRWEEQLGGSLIVWEKGQAAQLSKFGEKLLWAERQAQARLAPQIAALHADLERAFAVAFDPSAHVLTLYASHDDALALLHEVAATGVSAAGGTAAGDPAAGDPADGVPKEAAAAAPLRSTGALHLDIRFTGSVDAIRALNEGRCTLAGFHTLEGAAPGSETARTYKPLLQPGLHKLIGFARRTQGLIVARGNPLGLRRLSDVGARGARFVHRPLGTGTRVLLGDLLQREGLGPDALGSFAHTEPSHAAVAQAVASGSADAGLGIELAARTRGLDFVPLVHEQYHLACLKTSLDQAPTLALRTLLQSATWQSRMAQLAGYAPVHCGEVLAMSAVLPWWKFSAQKRVLGTTR